MIALTWPSPGVPSCLRFCRLLFNRRPIILVVLAQPRILLYSCDRLLHRNRRAQCFEQGWQGMGAEAQAACCAAECPLAGCVPKRSNAP